MRYAMGEKVIVTLFIRRGDEKDIEEVTGWVMFHGEDTITIANAEDWQSAAPELWGVTTYPLSEVIVEAAPVGFASETGAGQVPFILLCCLLAMAVVGLLGRCWPLLIGAAAVAGVVIVLALTGTRKETDQ